MKIETQPRDDHQVKVIAEVEPELFEKSKHQAARKISQEAKIPGFRPGKAPYNVVRRTFGDDTIQKEALELLVDEIYPKAIEQAGIKPYGPGNLDEIVSVEPPTFAFIIPLEPTVDLGDYRSISKPYELPQVTDQEVDEFIERLRSSYATVEPVERDAQEGDMVFATVTGTLTHPEEGKSPEIVKERPVQAVIQPEDKQDPSEWPFPGFARHLIGLSAGDEIPVTFTFPEESMYEALRGKEVEFKVKVDTVKSMKLPELNDEFAQSLGEFDSVEALRTSVRNGLEATSHDEYDQTYNTELIDLIREKATIQYPPQLLDEEEKSILSALERDLARQNMDIDTYLKVRQLEKDAFIEQEIKPSAVRRLERSLILDQIARDEKIEISNQDLESSFSETFAELQNTEDFQQMQKKIPANRLANAVAMEAASRLMNRRVFARIKSIATGIPEAEPTKEETTAPVAEQPATEEASEKTDEKPASDEQNPVE